MPEWITPVVSVVAIFISFILGSIQSRVSYDKKQKQLRYDEFYIPYLKKIYMFALHFKSSFYALPQEIRDEFIDLILEKVQYLGLKAQGLIHDLIVMHAGVLHDIEEGKENSEDGVQGIFAYDISFRIFTDAVIEEAQALCKDVHLPDITHTYRKHRNKIELNINKYSQKET